MRPRLPTPLNILLVAIGALAVGAKAAVNVAPTPDARTIVEAGKTRTVSSVRVHVVKRVIRGKVIHRDEKVYVRVPIIVVHTDHHVIRVPAHILPLRSAEATIANPLVTVYIPVPTTVFVPTTITETLPASTLTITIPTTITLPFDPTASDQEAP